MRFTKFTYAWLRDCKWYYRSLKLASLYRMVDLGYLRDGHVFSIDKDVRRTLIESGYQRISESGSFDVSLDAIESYILSLKNNSEYDAIRSIKEEKGFIPVESPILWESTDFIINLYLYLLLDDCTLSLDSLHRLFPKRIGEPNIDHSTKMGEKFRENMSMTPLTRITQANIQAVTATNPEYYLVKEGLVGVTPRAPKGYQLLGVHDISETKAQYWYHNAPKNSDMTFTYLPAHLWGTTRTKSISLSMLLSGLYGNLLPANIVHKKLENEGYEGNITVTPIIGYQPSTGKYSATEFYPLEDLAREYPETFQEPPKQDFYGAMLRLAEDVPNIPENKIAVSLFDMLDSESRLSSKPEETGKLLQSGLERTRSMNYAPQKVKTYDLSVLSGSYWYLFPNVLDNLKNVVKQTDLHNISSPTKLRRL